MVGSNFWAVQQEGGWIVREEGLPDSTTRHPSEDEAWSTAKERAAALHGEAFLQNDVGEICDRQSFRQMPPDFSPV
jgi:hypothetical protein